MIISSASPNLSDTDKAILDHLDRVMAGLSFPTECVWCKDAGADNYILRAVDDVGGIDLNTDKPFCVGCGEANAQEFSGYYA